MNKKEEEEVWLCWVYKETKKKTGERGDSGERLERRELREERKTRERMRGIGQMCLQRSKGGGGKEWRVRLNEEEDKEIGDGFVLC